MRETVNQLALHSLAETDISSPEALALALTTLGDGVLTRIHYHTVGAGLHMPEQIDKYTGYEASATDLTWSYSAVLDALQSRSQM
jgi:glucoamylase